MANENKYIWGQGYHSPETNLTSVLPYTITFMCHPTNSTDNTKGEYETPSNGWGYPFWGTGTDGSITKLPLGTLGGSNQVKLLNNSASQWGVANTPGSQVYGNIDWRGPVVDTLDDGTEVRMNITWNGPQMRYFPDDAYDWDTDKAYQVYYRGKIVAVTPHPVLGAAAKKVKDVWYLYIMCKKDTDDIMYLYRLGIGFSPSGLTSEVTGNFTSTYNEQTNPRGFKVLYTLDRQHYDIKDTKEEAKEARTPWFFNESCTKSICMREVDITYLDDTNNVEYTEPSTAKYTLEVGTINGSGFSFDFGSNLKRLVYRMQHEFTTWPRDSLDSTAALAANSDIWCMPPYDNTGHPEYNLPDCDWNNLTPEPDPQEDQTLNHQYRRWLLMQLIWCKGSQLVAVDFDGDSQIVARIVIEGIRTQNHELSSGVDCSTYYNKPIEQVQSCNSYQVTCPDGNGCQNDGKPGAGWDTGMPPEFKDGDPGPWTGMGTKYILKFTNAGGDKEFTIYDQLSGTEYEHEHGERKDEWDVGLEYQGYTKRFLHFIDMRHPYIFSYTELYVDQFITWGDGSTVVPPEGSINTQVWQRECHAVNTDKSTVLTEIVVKDTKETGHVVGYDVTGNTGAQKPSVQGPNWVYTRDATYNHTQDGIHVFETECHALSQSDLDMRNTDYDNIEPKFSEFWGNLKNHGFPSYFSFFNNSHYDEILGSTIHMNRSEGGLATNSEHWVLSYEASVSAVDTEYTKFNGNGVYLSYIDKKEYTSIGKLGVASRLYPVGVY